MSNDNVIGKGTGTGTNIVHNYDFVNTTLSATCLACKDIYHPVILPASSICPDCLDILGKMSKMMRNLKLVE